MNSTLHFGWYNDLSVFLEPAVSFLTETKLGIGETDLTLLSLFYGIGILILVFWIAAYISRTLENSLRKHSNLNYNTRELIVKFFRLFVYFIALMIAFSVAGIDLTAFAVFGGALGVGIGFGLQKIAANFISGITLLLEKSIKLGDLIEVGGTLGWVRQLNIRYTLVQTVDGRAILVPNDELTSTRVTSWTYTDNTARAEIKIGISYEADATKAQKLILEAALEHPLCLKDPIPTCQLREFGEMGPVLYLNFWIEDIREGRAGPQSEIMFSILKKFQDAGIEMKIKQV